MFMMLCIATYVYMFMQLCGDIIAIFLPSGDLRWLWKPWTIWFDHLPIKKWPSSQSTVRLSEGISQLQMIFGLKVPFADDFPFIHWIGLREHLEETMIFPMNYGCFLQSFP